MRSSLGKFIQNLLLRSPHDAKDSGDLIELTFSWKEGILGVKLKKHTAYAPHVHLLGVVAIRHEALGRPVPPGRNVLGMRPLGMQIFSL